MEDISSLVWLGIVVIWLLSRLVGRAARKSAGKRTGRPRPDVARRAPGRGEPPAVPAESQPRFTGPGGQGPPPIVPR